MLPAKPGTGARDDGDTVVKSNGHWPVSFFAVVWVVSWRPFARECRYFRPGQGRADAMYVRIVDTKPALAPPAASVFHPPRNPGAQSCPRPSPASAFSNSPATRPARAAA